MKNKYIFSITLLFLLVSCNSSLKITSNDIPSIEESEKLDHLSNYKCVLECNGYIDNQECQYINNCEVTLYNNKMIKMYNYDSLKKKKEIVNIFYHNKILYKTSEVIIDNESKKSLTYENDDEGLQFIAENKRIEDNDFLNLYSNMKENYNQLINYSQNGFKDDSLIQYKIKNESLVKRNDEYRYVCNLINDDYQKYSISFTANINNHHLLSITKVIKADLLNYDGKEIENYSMKLMYSISFNSRQDGKRPNINDYMTNEN